MRSRKGFTTLELLIVMIIVGVLVAIVAPRVADVGTKNNVHSARYKVVSAIATARAAAIQQSASARFRLTKDTIWVQRITGVNAPITILQKASLNQSYGVSVVTKTDAGATKSTLDVIFDARGIASLADNWYQIVMSAGTTADTVCVQKFGGSHVGPC